MPCQSLENEKVGLLKRRPESITFAEITNLIAFFWFNRHNNHKFTKIHRNDLKNPLPDHW